MLYFIIPAIILISAFLFIYPRVKEHLDRYNKYMNFCYYNYFDQVDARFSQEYVAVLQGGDIIDSDVLFYRLRDRLHTTYPDEQYQIVYVP